MQLFKGLFGIIVMFQIALLIVFHFFDKQANALYVFYDFSWVYGSLIFTSGILYVYLIMQFLRNVKLKKVGSKASQTTKTWK